MSIENEINQTVFKNEYQKSVINIIYTYNWITEKLKHIFEKEGLTMQQFNILRILRGSNKPLTTLQIRERMLDKMSDTSRIVDRLIVKELVKKCISKLDKRLVDIIITDKGKKILLKIDKKESEINNLLSSITETEAKTLNKILDKIRNNN